MRRIGVFGGTFDPPHLGHLVAAANARYLLGLDTVLFVVANDPWQKTGERRVSPAEDRYALVEAALSGRPGLVASRVEIERGGPSYTIDTLEALEQAEPDAHLVVLVGADVVGGLSSWQRPDELRRVARLGVLSRPGTDDAAAVARADGWTAERVEVPLVEVSSSDLRARARDGRPLDFLVPDPVIALIAARGLYAVGT